jgi:hypothetical protein
MSRPSIVLSGALVRIYINNKLYREAQQVQYVLDSGETEIYGIDSPFPQEIASTRTMVSGSISGIRIRNSGGLQSYNAKPLITDIIKSLYVSIRIQDRSSGEDLLFIPNAKITQQSVQASVKGIVRLNFNFKGLVGFESLDRSS